MLEFSTLRENLAITLRHDSINGYLVVPKLLYKERMNSLSCIIEKIYLHFFYGYSNLNVIKR